LQATDTQLTHTQLFQILCNHLFCSQANALIQESYKTTLCIEFPPQVIALAALHLATRFLKGKYTLDGPEPGTTKSRKWYAPFVEVRGCAFPVQLQLDLPMLLFVKGDKLRLTGALWAHAIWGDMANEWLAGQHRRSNQGDIEPGGRGF
jgi:hypothetical protein